MLKETEIRRRGTSCQLTLAWKPVLIITALFFHPSHPERQEKSWNSPLFNFFQSTSTAFFGVCNIPLLANLNHVAARFFLKGTLAEKLLLCLCLVGARAAWEVWESSLNFKEKRGNGSEGHEVVTREVQGVTAIRDELAPSPSLQKCQSLS